MQPTPKPIKRRVIFVLIVILALVFLYWVYNTSVIQVTVVNGQDGTPITYSLLKQPAKQAGADTSSKNSLKKLVAHGNYEVEVKQGNSSYFTAIKARGFLRKTTVSASLQSQSSREFVGNNPRSCMDYVGGQLVSYTCGDFYSNVFTHVPATATTPTYTLVNSQTKIFGYLRGMVNTPEGTLALVQPANAENSSSHYTLYRVNKSLASLQKTNLPELAISQVYQIRPFMNGFVIYDSSFSQILYYTSSGSKPQTIKMRQPGGGLSAKAIFFDSTAARIMTLFSNGKTESRAVVEQGGQSQTYSFKQNYSSGGFCGSQSLCLIGANQHMDIYALSGQTASFSYSLTGVQAIQQINNVFLIINRDGVIRFDAASRSGAFDLAFGSYRYCGFQPGTSSTYLLCLINSKGDRVALRVDETIADADSIDQQVAQLLTMPEVSGVSAYGKYVYISPNLGQLQHISGGGLGYNSEEIQAVNSEIKADIKRVGIDTSHYKVINPYD
ncbi:MAG TPA: hypothetical protein VHD84_01025 [Candidatus Saccharimonadales bacterium]|nr:hypothetical protein [Candidatus Saccharimonadales bacterium]